jgi:hypothetical protein
MSPTTHLVVWGLRHKYDTYRYIHAGFAAAARRLGWQVDWVEDSQSNQAAVTPSSLVVGVNLCQQYLPLVTGARYVIHNNERADLASAITNGAGINLQTWTFNCPGEPIDGRQAIRFNAATRTLFQPWGTSVPVDKWSKPNLSNSKLVFWVGSVWNNDLDQGNKSVIAELAGALANQNRRLVHFWRTPEILHKRLIQLSGLRPAVCGKWQADNGYIPCRAFKNLSFGALPITNNQAINVALGDSIPCHSSMQELVEGYLNMRPDDILSRTQQAQSHLEAFTYESNLKRFAKLTSGV